MVITRQKLCTFTKKFTTKYNNVKSLYVMKVRNNY